MKRKVLIALLVSLIFSPVFAWVQKDTIGGGPRSAASGFNIGSAAFVCLGLDSNSYKRSLWMYAPSNDTWTQMESFGGATGSGLDRDVAMAFSIGNKAYVVGGQGSNPFYNDCWEYDFVTDTWMQKQNFNGGGRRAGVAFAVNGKGYVGLGQAATGLKNDLWEYDPAANLWVAKANFPGTARRFAACFVINGKAYVGTGDDGAFKGDMFEYDPATNQWTSKAAFGGTPRYGTVSFTLYNKGYIGLGYDNTLQNTDDIWEYDPVSNSWIFKDNFPGSKRANATAVSCSNNKCYIGLGYDSLLRDDWWEFDPLIDGIHENQDWSALLNVFPNPASDKISLTLDIPADRNDVMILMTDLTGKVITSQMYSGTGMQLEVGSYAKGCYLLQIISEGQIMATKKLIVSGN